MRRFVSLAAYMNYFMFQGHNISDHDQIGVLRTADLDDT